MSQKQHDVQEQVQTQVKDAEHNNSDSPDLNGKSEEEDSTSVVPENAENSEKVDEDTALKAPRKRRGTKKARKVTEEDIVLPRPSYWPLALALALVVFLFGAVFNGIILIIGLVLVVASVIGWALERR